MTLGLVFTGPPHSTFVLNPVLGSQSGLVFKGPDQVFDLSVPPFSTKDFFKICENLKTFFFTAIKINWDQGREVVSTEHILTAT